MDNFNLEQIINSQLIGEDMDEKEDLYSDPRFEMYSDEEQFKMLLKVYGFAFAFVIFVILPWAVGGCMLIKWIVF